MANFKSQQQHWIGHYHQLSLRLLNERFAVGLSYPPGRRLLAVSGPETTARREGQDAAAPPMDVVCEQREVLNKSAFFTYICKNAFQVIVHSVVISCSGIIHMNMTYSRTYLLLWLLRLHDLTSSRKICCNFIMLNWYSFIPMGVRGQAASESLNIVIL